MSRRTCCFALDCFEEQYDHLIALKRSLITCEFEFSEPTGRHPVPPTLFHYPAKTSPQAKALTAARIPLPVAASFADRHAHRRLLSQSPGRRKDELIELLHCSRWLRSNLLSYAPGMPQSFAAALAWPTS